MKTRGPQSKINLFVAGDSTTGLNPPSPKTGAKISWADVLNRHFRQSRVVYYNEARPGYSLRDYISRGSLDEIFKKTRRGDILLACHGHLEGAPLTRKNERARGCLAGVGDEICRVYDPHFDRYETVHTFGWYLNHHFTLCQNHGVRVIYLSPAVRNMWANGVIQRTSSISKAKMIRQICQNTGAGFLDFASVTEKFLNAIGREYSQALYLATDDTHTNVHGALLYARLLTESLLEQFPELFLPIINRRSIAGRSLALRIATMNLTNSTTKSRTRGMAPCSGRG